ncbi:hypothetical protein C7S16_1464 [Burkholderia thailandensis]|uniref:Uncharacterized protein n=1 Tax=Burkholderia thailandensis TaxID=57975 RepID=A0AAW9D4P3_BURTH|nr:hypothetical protein [Burkholderia thailandensis]MDW9256887.1 hypothetical protein [Burkholderia thailandensis]
MPPRRDGFESTGRASGRLCFRGAVRAAHAAMLERCGERRNRGE